MSCNDDDEHHCMTCSDEAVEMRVLDPGRDGVAVCDRGEVMTDLVGPVDEGDVVLVHAGVAIARVGGRRLDGARQGAELPALPAAERGQ